MTGLQGPLFFFFIWNSLRVLWNACLPLYKPILISGNQGGNDSIRLARALHSILVWKDNNDIGQYNVLSKGDLPGFNKREITADLKEWGSGPFSKDSLNISRRCGNNFPENSLYISIGVPFGPGAFPLLMIFNTSDSSAILVLTSSVSVGNWSWSKNSLSCCELPGYSDFHNNIF